VAVKRSNTRYIRLNSIDGEQYFYQLLLLNINFRVFAELITDAYLTKTYKEEAIIRGLFYEEESDVQIDLENNNCKNNARLNLKQAAQKMCDINILDVANSMQVDDIFYLEESNIDDVDHQLLKKLKKIIIH
jgi:hypothetical protein